jgi:hypothetical protein
MSLISNEFLLLRKLRLKIDLIPGPPHNDAGLYNQAIQVIARYPAESTATDISALPGISLVTDGSRDPIAWQWLWREGSRTIRIGFTVMGKDTGPKAVWGGSSLECDCYVGDLLGLWGNFRKTHSDTWLHYDGRVYTGHVFLEKLRQMIEDQAITDIL